MKGVIEVFWTALQLGLTAFGGPVAHIGFFREQYVEKRKWVTEQRFAELMAITQFLPGPASSQLGAAFGYQRAGWLGGFAAWLGFTLPSAIILILFAIGIEALEQDQLFWIKGLTIAALGVVLNAVVGMQQKLCGRDWFCNLIAILGFLFLLRFYHGWMQPLVILVGGLVGIFCFKSEVLKPEAKHRGNLKKWCVAACMVGVVVAVPLLLTGSRDLAATGGIFQAGSLVFGGGHVVLPMLSAEVVDPGYIGEEEFTAGYGMTQAMPGPCFTFAGYLGAKIPIFGNPWLGGMVGLVAVFLPGMLLLTGCVPVWDSLKEQAWARSAMRGANAAVVGLLAAAVFKILKHGGMDLWWEWSMVLGCFLLLRLKVTPVWALVIAMGGVGYLVYAPG